MSKYTTEVRHICETYAGYTEAQDYTEVNDIITASMGQIFENYPIFDETYRATLNKKILRHYYTREICAETVGLWKLWLNNKMNEIMPYYNQLYKSALLSFNPLYDVDLTTVRSVDGTSREVSDITSSTEDSRSGSSNRKTDSLNTNDNIVKSLDTPQGGLQGLINDQYMTAGTNENGNNVYSGKEKGSTSTSGESETNTDGTKDINTTESYLEHVAGKNGGENYSKKLLDYRKTFINIDERVINELSGLFFGLWE